jgi:hypothetical protein
MTTALRSMTNAVSAHRLVTKQCQLCHADYQVRRDKAERSKFCSAKCQIDNNRILRWRRHVESKYVELFWARVDRSNGPNSCWLWTGAKGHHGYGFLNFRKRVWRAHRLSYYIANGAFDQSLCVCHACDTPLCVNPAHLWLGTNQENTADRDAKGRAARGNRHGMSKSARAKREAAQCQ